MQATINIVESADSHQALLDQRIESLLSVARRLGVKRKEDAIFFVLNGLTLSDAWHEHPQARRCIERSCREGVALARLMSELSEDELHEIRYHGAGRC